MFINVNKVATLPTCFNINPTFHQNTSVTKWLLRQKITNLNFDKIFKFIWMVFKLVRQKLYKKI
jgi:hypothetical protein